MVAGAPMMWNRVLPGFNEWLAEVFQQDQAIDQCSLECDVEALGQQHSKFDIADPCKIEPYKFVPHDRDVQHISELKQGAAVGKETDLQSVSTTRAAISAVVDADAAQDLGALVTNLTTLQHGEINKVRNASALLEEIVSPDPDKRKGREEVLRATFPPAEVDNMHADAKTKAYREVRSRRILERATFALDAAKTLCSDDLWKPVLDKSYQNQHQMLEYKSRVQELHQRAQLAVTKHDEVVTIENALGESLELAQQKLKLCKVQKTSVCKALDGKRASFKAALEKVRGEYKAYKDLHIENEAARIQISNLEESIQTTRDRLQVAQAEGLVAKAVCHLWSMDSKNEAQQLDLVIDTEVCQCMNRANGLLEIAATSVGTAQELLKNLCEENTAEVASLQGDIDFNQHKLQQLQAQMVADEPDQDIVEIESDLALRTDEQKSYNAAMEKCISMRSELEQATPVANSRWSQLCEHKNLLGSIISMDAVCTAVHESSGSCYKTYQLWKKAISRNSVAPPPNLGALGSINESNALMTLDPQAQAWIERLIEQKSEQKAEQKILQFRADFLFRTTGDSFGSVASSDAGESWTQVPLSEATAGPEASNDLTADS